MTTKQDMEAVAPKTQGPNHYKKYKIQPWEFIRKNNLTPFQANVIKYVMRFQDKDGIKDLNKIKHYCDLEIEFIRESWDDQTN